MSEHPETLRFGDFELNIARYELRRNGRPLRLERQPMDLLIMLAGRRGRLVHREEIVEALWGKDVFVDVDTGVHTAIRKIRRALGDAAEQPTFIETVPGKGYRFLAAVEVVGGGVTASADTPVAAEVAPSEITSDTSAPPIDAPAVAAPAPPPRRNRSLGWGVAIALVAIAGGVTAWTRFARQVEPAPVTIAVLPFENLGTDADRAYLADGLTEEIITWLGQVDSERLSVVSRMSAAIARKSAGSLAEIGRELGVDYLLESSVRAESGRVRITTKLIRASDQVQVWSQIYTRELTSILGLQQELGAAIAEQIRFRLSPERFEALARRQPRSAAAYDEYLRGLTFASHRTPATTQKAIEHYARATAIDPDYALAWAALAVAQAAGVLNSDVAPLAVRASARDAAERAIRANPDLAEAQYARGYLYWTLEWDWPAAEAGLRRAIDLDPRYAWAHLTLGHALSQSGRHDEALRALRRARELDPLEVMMQAVSSQVAFQARDHRAALDHASQAIAADQGLWIGHMMRSQALEQSGQIEEALDALEIAARYSADNSKTLSLRGYVLARANRRDEARQVLATLEAQAKQRYVPPFAFALVHAGLGDRDAMFEWLERAFDARDVHLMYLTVDPKWDPYRTDPRFEALLARCGFTPAVAAATGR